MARFAFEEFFDSKGWDGVKLWLFLLIKKREKQKTRGTGRHEPFFLDRLGRSFEASKTVQNINLTVSE